MVQFVRLSHIFDNVPDIVTSWNFHEWLPLTKLIPVQKDKARGEQDRRWNAEKPSATLDP